MKPGRFKHLHEANVAIGKVREWSEEISKLWRQADFLASSRGKLLSLVCNGNARIEVWPNGKRCEVCMNGLRYVADVDIAGVPIIHANLLAAIDAALAKAQARS